MSAQKNGWDHAATVCGTTLSIATIAPRTPTIVSYHPPIPQSQFLLLSSMLIVNFSLLEFQQGEGVPSITQPFEGSEEKHAKTLMSDDYGVSRWGQGSIYRGAD